MTTNAEYFHYWRGSQNYLITVVDHVLIDVDVSEGIDDFIGGGNIVLSGGYYSIAPDAFKNCGGLSHVALYRSDITVLDLGIFDHLPNLRSLDIVSNDHLTAITGELRGFSKDHLISIRIEGMSHDLINERENIWDDPNEEREFFIKHHPVKLEVSPKAFVNTTIEQLIMHFVNVADLTGFDTIYTYEIRMNRCYLPSVDNLKIKNHKLQRLRFNNCEIR